VTPNYEDQFCRSR